MALTQMINNKMTLSEGRRDSRGTYLLKYTYCSKLTLTDVVYLGTQTVLNLDEFLHNRCALQSCPNAEEPVTNDGRNRFSCYPCDYTMCAGCVALAGGAGVYLKCHHFINYI
jgi:hypothetical protein